VPLATPLDIELRDIQVLVFWANTEQAASGASVEWKALTESAPEAVAGRLPAVTNAAGQALLSVPAESAAIVLTAQHAEAETYRIQLEPQSGNPVRIELQLVFWIRGIVRDVETGAVLPGATVALGADEKHEAISGADGGFHIRDLQPDTYAVTAWAEDYAVTRRDVEVGQRGESLCMLKLDPAIQVAVTVVDGSGTPVEGAVVGSALRPWGQLRGLSDE
jgi:hypothetical protein